MHKKIKRAAMIIENVGFIAFGITNAIGGVYLWHFQPLFTVSMCILSLINIAKGVSELLLKYKAYRMKG